MRTNAKTQNIFTLASKNKLYREIEQSVSLQEVLREIAIG